MKKGNYRSFFQICLMSGESLCQITCQCLQSFEINGSLRILSMIFRAVAPLGYFQLMGSKISMLANIKMDKKIHKYSKYQPYFNLFFLKTMGQINIFSKLMGPAEPIEPMVTEPLQTSFGRLACKKCKSLLVEATSYCLDYKSPHLIT